MGKFSQKVVCVYVHVDGGDGMGNKWQDTGERKLFCPVYPTWEAALYGERIGLWFSAP